MNYVAHLFFADPTPDSRVGQLMGDFYAGRIGPELPAAVAEGVRLHRRIDAFTDSHPRVVRARQRMQGPRRRFAGIILDLAFDHFLCRHWDAFHPQPLDRFLDQVYADLGAYTGFLPEPMAVPLERICQQRWLSVYREVEGTARALERMARRLSRPTALAQGGVEIVRHYPELERDFLIFFPQLVEFVARERLAPTQADPGNGAPAKGL